MWGADQSQLQLRVAPGDTTKNAFDVFIEAFVLFLAGALGMLLPLMVMTSNSVRYCLCASFFRTRN